MIVIVLENAPPKLRGRLALWFVEVRAGVYVGRCSAKTRESLWKEIQKFLDGGNAVMAWKAPTESGFKFKTAGLNRRVPIDLDGVRLVRFQPEIGLPDTQRG